MHARIITGSEGTRRHERHKQTGAPVSLQKIRSPRLFSSYLYKRSFRSLQKRLVFVQGLDKKDPSPLMERGRERVIEWHKNCRRAWQK